MKLFRPPELGHSAAMPREGVLYEGDEDKLMAS
jgi:hypothetical protein